MRMRIEAALKDAIKSQDTTRTSTLRLICAALKDKEIALRGDDQANGLSEQQVLEILARMIKQREESAQIYEEGGRLELAERERAEIDVIRQFMPEQLSQEEVSQAITSAIAEAGAQSIRDVGKVIALIKGKYPGQIDVVKVGPQVKSALCAQ
jgi:uncharacterized protein YqeY